MSRCRLLLILGPLCGQVWESNSPRCYLATHDMSDRCGCGVERRASGRGLGQPCGSIHSPSCRGLTHARTVLEDRAGQRKGLVRFLPALLSPQKVGGFFSKWKQRFSEQLPGWAKVPSKAKSFLPETHAPASAGWPATGKCLFLEKRCRRPGRPGVAAHHRPAVPGTISGAALSWSFSEHLQGRRGRGEPRQASRNSALRAPLVLPADEMRVALKLCDKS